MGKRKEFRYEPINFGDDSDEEDSTILARELGSSSRSGSGGGRAGGRCGERCLRGCFIVSIILATAAAVGAALLYTSVIEPPEGGIMSVVGLGNKDVNGTVSGDDGNSTAVLNGTLVGNATAEGNATLPEENGEDDAESQGDADDDNNESEEEEEEDEKEEEQETVGEEDEREEEDEANPGRRTSGPGVDPRRNGNGGSEENPRFAALGMTRQGRGKMTTMNDKDNPSRQGFSYGDTVDPWGGGLSATSSSSGRLYDWGSDGDDDSSDFDMEEEEEEDLSEERVKEEEEEAVDDQKPSEVKDVDGAAQKEREIGQESFSDQDRVEEANTGNGTEAEEGKSAQGEEGGGGGEEEDGALGNFSKYLVVS